MRYHECPKCYGDKAMWQVGDDGIRYNFCFDCEYDEEEEARAKLEEAHHLMSLDGKPYQLYCWDRPFNVNFGGSFLVVPARSLIEAKKKAQNAIITHGYLKVCCLGPGHASKLGAPTMVLDVVEGGVCIEWTH